MCHIGVVGTHLSKYRVLGTENRICSKAIDDKNYWFKLLDFVLLNPRCCQCGQEFVDERVEHLTTDQKLGGLGSPKSTFFLTHGFGV